MDLGGLKLKLYYVYFKLLKRQIFKTKCIKCSFTQCQHKFTEAHLQVRVFLAVSEPTLGMGQLGCPHSTVLPNIIVNVFFI